MRLSKNELKNAALFLILLIPIAYSAELRVTLEHPFLLEGGWVAASELKVGDELTTSDGRKARIKNIIDVGSQVEVYNLHVAGPNTFFANDILVHNKAMPARKGHPYLPDVPEEKLSLTASSMETEGERAFAAEFVRESYSKRFMEAYAKAMADPANKGKTIQQLIDAKVIKPGDVAMALYADDAAQKVLSGKIDRVILFASKSGDDYPALAMQGSYESPLVKTVAQHGMRTREITVYSTGRNPIAGKQPFEVIARTALDALDYPDVEGISILVEMREARIYARYLPCQYAPKKMVEAYVLSNPGHELVCDTIKGQTVWYAQHTDSGMLLGQPVQAEISDVIMISKPEISEALLNLLKGQ